MRSPLTRRGASASIPDPPAKPAQDTRARDEAPARAGVSTTLALLACIGLVAAAARIYRFDARSLWLDEILTAQTAHLAGPADVINWCQAAINQMPLYYLFTWFLGHWGDDAILLRLPALVAGILAVPAVYLLGSRLFGSRAGLVAALLLAVMPFAVWYSQEARNYSFLMLLTTLQMYFAYEAVIRNRIVDWLGLSLFTTLDLYTHYLALVSTAAVAVYIGLFLAGRVLHRSGRWTTAGLAIALVALVAAAAAAPWRSALRAGYRYIVEVASPPFRSVAGVAALIGLVAILVIVTAVVIGRSRRFKLLACTGLLTLLVLLLVVLRPGMPGAMGAHLQLRFAVALAAVGVALLIALGLLLLDVLDPPVEAQRMLVGALAAGGLAALLYAPWVPTLRVFLSRPDQSILRFDPRQGASLGEVLGVLTRLGLSGVLLAGFLLGLTALVAWLFRGRRPEAALLLCWIVIPVLLTWLSVRWAIVDIDLRYFASLLPAATLVVAAAIEAIVESLETGLRKLRTRSLWGLRFPAATVASVALVILLLVQALPALAASYQLNKDDYRATARHIAAASPPGSVVLALGNYADWTVICLGYYFHQIHAPIAVVEGTQVDSDIGARLAAGGGTVWGVVIFPSPAQLALLSGVGEATSDFTDVTGNIHTIRAAAASLTPTEQAEALLRWELPLQPQLSAPNKLLDELAGRAELGANLVPDPGAAPPGETGWRFSPGASVVLDAVALAPSTSIPEANASFTGPIQSGADYAVSFEYRNSSLGGPQRVYVLLGDVAGHTISTSPGGYGFECARSSAWKRSAFAFAAPAAASSFTVLLRAAGSGSAEFRGPRLSRIQDPA